MTTSTSSFRAIRMGSRTRSFRTRTESRSWSRRRSPMGTAYDDIDVTIDLETKDIIEKSARIITTYGDAGPGLTPVAEVASLVAKAVSTVAPLVNQVIAEAASDLSRLENPAGESTLGNLIADAQRTAMETRRGLHESGRHPCRHPGGTGHLGRIVHHAAVRKQPRYNGLSRALRFSRFWNSNGRTSRSRGSSRHPASRTRGMRPSRWEAASSPRA